MVPPHIQEIITRYAHGEASSHEISQLMQWYRAQEVSDVSWPSSSPAEHDALSQRVHQRLMHEVKPSGGKRITIPWMKAAAMVLIVAGITSLLIYLNSSPAYVTITSPAGEVTPVDLPDGSRAWLNASTELQYAKNFGQNRQVKLSGEGYFEVKRDTIHPFIVDAGGLKTTVLGTSFNISNYPSEQLISVSVITGRVGVSAYGQKERVLTPAMHVQFDKQSSRLSVGTTDTAAVLAWKAGRLQFHGKTLDVIAKRLEQWYGYQILFATPGSSRCRYYMTFRNTLTLEEILTAMSEITEMKYEINQQKKSVTLSGKECR